MVTAKLTNYRQSPRKVRLIADLVRGKNAQVALDTLTFTPNKAAEPLRKLIASAVANAQNTQGLSAADLTVKEIRVDKGVTAYRFRPRARGRAFPIRKRSSHVVVSLDSKKGAVAAQTETAPEKEEVTNENK